MKRSFGQQVASFFAFYCILFIPFPFSLFKGQSAVTDFLFGRLIGFTSQNLFGMTRVHTRVSSDTVSMYILVLLLFLLSLFSVGILSNIKKWEKHREKIILFFYSVSRYYLALLLLKYGLDKVFKNQFYVPEPNTLYTPMGRVEKDLLFWSSMGTSWLYSFFLGALELLASVFILIKRTRLVGLLMSFMIMLNVVSINFGFDISVKLFSLFLLFLSGYLLAPYWQPLVHFFLQRKTTGIDTTVNKSRKTFGFIFLKWVVIGLMLLEALYPFITRKDLNGDLVKRPYLHGAYEVKLVLADNDSIPLISSPVKRLFVHRKGYMIFQDQKDAMQDFKLSFDKSGSVIILTDYQLHQTRVPFSYNTSDSVLVLHYLVAGKEYQLTAKALDWKKLPAVQKGFHWTTDGGK